MFDVMRSYAEQERKGNNSMPSQTIYLPIPPDFWERYEFLAYVASKEELIERQKKGERPRLGFSLKNKGLSCILMVHAMNAWHTGYPYHIPIDRLFSKDGGMIEGGKAILNAILSFDNLKAEAAILKMQGWPVDIDAPKDGLMGYYKYWFILGKSEDPSKEVCQYLRASESSDAQRVMEALMDARLDIQEWECHYRVRWSNGRQGPWSLWESLPQYKNHNDWRKKAEFHL